MDGHLPHRANNGLHPRAHVKPPLGGFDMFVRGDGGDAKPRPDFRIGKALGAEAQHIALARRQRAYLVREQSQAFGAFMKQGGQML